MATIVMQNTQAALNRAKFAIKSYTIQLFSNDEMAHFRSVILRKSRQQHGPPRRSRSIIYDAKFDRLANREYRRSRGLEPGESTESTDATKTSKHQKQANYRQRKSHDEKNSAEDNNYAIDCSDDDDEQAQVWAQFPRHISQLDDCHHLLIKYEPELDPTHPGFHDVEYRARRKQVAEIAFSYRYGQPIPEVDYSQKEIETWGFIYNKLKEAYSKWACESHNKAIRLLELEAGYSAHSIPQLERVSRFLERTSGWRLRPAAGLLSARDFLASLAFRVFQTTQYIRHWGNPEHSVEPDCIHELMGHIPMLCDPGFSQFSQELGLASLGASDRQIERLATLYWFSVEFGLCREGGQLKCYGAGLLSSFGEMEHALESGKPQLREFQAEVTALEPYDDADYQTVYFVAQSFEGAKLEVRRYAAAHLQRPHELLYDPFTCSIRQLDTLGQLKQLANQIRTDVSTLSSAISKMQLGSNHKVEHDNNHSTIMTNNSS